MNLYISYHLYVVNKNPRPQATAVLSVCQPSWKPKGSATEFIETNVMLQLPWRRGAAARR